MTTVNVRLFAGLHDLVGRKELAVSLPAGSTVEQLRQQLGEEYPVLQGFLPTLVCAVEEEVVPGEQVLAEGDRIELIPPIAGG
jgi:molybdopterin converting factor subunit 1